MKLPGWVVGAVIAMAAAPAAAQGDWGYPTVFDLALGAHASELPTASYIDFACGTDGGPPSRLIGGFTGFAACPAEARGLHEVYFRYDDEAEYIARARGVAGPLPSLYAGTTVFDFEVIVSALFDNAGILQAIRLVTDPRTEQGRRVEAYLLSNFLALRYDIGAAHCRDLPPAAGETGIGPLFIKRACERTLPDTAERVVLATHHYRRPGHLAFTPNARVRTEGELWSETRLEIHRQPDPAADAATLARIAGAWPKDDADPLAERARDCEGCDLARAELKRADLSRAWLAGADLTSANLHGANLADADLRGADLSGANLNKADLRGADLTGASLRGAMLYAARLEGARLDGADLSLALMGTAQLTRIAGNGLLLVNADLRQARLTFVDLAGADLSGARLDSASMNRASLQGARLDGAILYRAELRDADLSAASLAGADLYGADLGGADLAGADFSGARLTTASLANATLDGATFTGATMPDGTTQP